MNARLLIRHIRVANFHLFGFVGLRTWGMKINTQRDLHLRDMLLIRISQSR